MIVDSDRHVRRLNLILSERERDFFVNKITHDLARSRAYLEVLLSGPLTDRQHNVVAGRYRVIVLIDAAHAEHVLSSLRGLIA